MNFGNVSIYDIALLFFGLVGFVNDSLGIYEKLHHHSESCDK